MTNLDTTTTTLSVDEARDLTQRVRQTGAILAAQIERAYVGRIWEALGFDTFHDWLDDALGDARPKLTRDERRSLVSTLREAGESTRSIASVAGVSVGTVHHDITCSELNTSTDDEIIDAEVAEPITTTNVVGRDGKKYPAKKVHANTPAPRLRFNQTHNYWKMQSAARRLANRLEAVAADDRFDKNPPDSMFLGEAHRLLDAVAEIITGRAMTAKVTNGGERVYVAGRWRLMPTTRRPAQQAAQVEAMRQLVASRPDEFPVGHPLRQRLGLDEEDAAALDAGLPGTLIRLIDEYGRERVCQALDEAVTL